jgi:hypothetical protein
MIARLRAQIVKELLSLLRDPRSRLVLIGPPLAQLFIFSFAATLDVTNVRIAILNDDAGRWSREMIHRLEGATFGRCTLFRRYARRARRRHRPPRRHCRGQISLRLFAPG